MGERYIRCDLEDSPPQPIPKTERGRWYAHLLGNTMGMCAYESNWMGYAGSIKHLSEYTFAKWIHTDNRTFAHTGRRANRTKLYDTEPNRAEIQIQSRRLTSGGTENRIRKPSERNKRQTSAKLNKRFIDSTPKWSWNYATYRKMAPT